MRKPCGPRHLQGVLRRRLDSTRRAQNAIRDGDDGALPSHTFNDRAKSPDSPDSTTYYHKEFFFFFTERKSQSDLTQQVGRYQPARCGGGHAYAGPPRTWWQVWGSTQYLPAPPHRTMEKSSRKYSGRGVGTGQRQPIQVLVTEKLRRVRVKAPDRELRAYAVLYINC